MPTFIYTHTHTHTHKDLRSLNTAQNRSCVESYCTVRHWCCAHKTTLTVRALAWLKNWNIMHNAANVPYFTCKSFIHEAFTQWRQHTYRLHTREWFEYSAS